MYELIAPYDSYARTDPYRLEAICIYCWQCLSRDKQAAYRRTKILDDPRLLANTHLRDAALHPTAKASGLWPLLSNSLRSCKTDALDPAEYLFEDSAAGYRRRAGARRAKGRWADAIADYIEAIKRDPTNADLYRAKALTLHMQGNIKEASEAYEIAAKLFEKQGQLKKANDIREMLAIGLPPQVD